MMELLNEHYSPPIPSSKFVLQGFPDCSTDLNPDCLAVAVRLMLQCKDLDNILK
jgi:hypothetical protein